MGDDSILELVVSPFAVVYFESAYAIAVGRCIEDISISIVDAFDFSGEAYSEY